LVVDDEPLLRAALVSYFSDLGCVVDEAEDGLAAWELYQRNPVDLVLTDLRMPRLDGVGLVQRIRAHDPETAVVVVSAVAEASEIIAALRAGAWDYLLKPVGDLEMVRHRVESALERRRLETERRIYQHHMARSQAQVHAAQQEIIQAAQMAAVGELALGLVHAINTPLGVGMTAASVVAERAQAAAQWLSQGDLAPGPLQGTLETLVQAARLVVDSLQRASQVVEAVGRLAAQYRSGDAVKLDLGDYLRQAKSVLAPQVEAAGHGMDIVCPASLSVRTVPGAILQILVQLVRNSLDHGLALSPPGQRIHITVEVEASWVRIRYQDSGCGIPGHIRERIFEPFVSTATDHLGLGLSIARVLAAQALGGRLLLLPETPGAHFLLEFPSQPVACPYVPGAY